MSPHSIRRRASHPLIIPRTHSAPSHLRQPSPAGSPDAALDLQEVVALAYRRGGYDSEIDYSVPPPPPWTAGETGWIRDRLGLVREAG